MQHVRLVSEHVHLEPLLAQQEALWSAQPGRRYSGKLSSNVSFLG